MLATWGEHPSIGLGGRGQAAWRLRQRVDKDCMGELATGHCLAVQTIRCRGLGGGI